MRVHVLILAVACLVMTSGAPAGAQDSPSSLSDLKGDWQGGIRQPASLKSLMLVDPSRLTVSHSVTMSYGTGWGYGSGEGSVTGLYLSHLDYQISEPLHVWVDVGVGYQPSLEMDSGMGPEVVLPAFGLHYQPSEHFRLDVLVQNPRYYYNPYRPSRMWQR